MNYNFNVKPFVNKNKNTNVIAITKAIRFTV